MLVGNPLEPFSDVAGVQLVLALIRLLLLEGRGFVEHNLALLRTAVHADGPPLVGALLLDVFDDGLELARAHAVLDDDVVDSIPVVVLLGLLRIEGVGLSRAVE